MPMQGKTKLIIRSFFLLVLLCGVLAGMVYIYTEKPDERITEIQTEGGIYLSGQEYLRQVNLINRSNFEFKEPYELKQTIENHPYIEQADVELTPRNILKVTLHEKKMYAFVRFGPEIKILADQNELLPLVENIKNTDLPLVSAVDSILGKPADKELPGEVYGMVERVVASDVENNSPKRLSEIVFTAKNTILLMYNGVAGYMKTSGKNIDESLPVINAMLKNKEFDYLLQTSIYIDLRFGNRVYIATHEREETII